MIGWYVHHHGVGHRRRLEAVVPHLTTHVTGLGSGEPPEALDASWVHLSRDDGGGTATDPTAGGLFHWAPIGDQGLRHRMATLAAWTDVTDCRLFVVDGSVEVALFARLLGLPTVVVAARGRREDRPHHLALDAATAILAPWVRDAQPRWPSRWLDKTHWVGGFSRYDGRRDPGEPPACGAGRCAVLVLGSGGHVLLPDDVPAAADATPGWHWHVAGRMTPREHPRVVHHGVVDDVWPLLTHADVVVGPSGSGLVGEVAAAGARFVALPQPRPFREQEDRADRLADLGMLVRGPSRPRGAEWAELLDRATELDPSGWAWLHDGKGAARTAMVLDALAERGPVPPGRPAGVADPSVTGLDGEPAAHLTSSSP